MRNQTACRVLLVDDETAWAHSTADSLYYAGIDHVQVCSDPNAVIGLLDSERPFDVILLDICMPQLSGEELLPRIRMKSPEVPVIMLTAVDQVETVVRCLKAGAENYLTKPVEVNQLLASIRQVVALQDARGEVRRLRERIGWERLSRPEAFDEIVTESQAMITMFEYIESVARSHHTVLITGETGTGKELVARALHNCSDLSGPLVAVNVAGIDPTTAHSTLFGHRRGAFTGADRDRAGLVEKAAGGTLFLDEIGDLSEPMQIKLLRLLQEREFFPLGADRPRDMSARVIVATHRDIRDESVFRRDLYYRLKTHHVTIPPLRSRLEDVPALVRHFTRKASDDLGTKAPVVPEQIFPILANYHFPGNVRELEAMIHDAVSRSRFGHMSLDPIRQHIAAARDEAGGDWKDASAGANTTHAATLDPAALATLPTIDQMQTELIREALRRADGNRTSAAQMLGLSRAALLRRLKTIDQMETSTTGA